MSTAHGQTSQPLTPPLPLHVEKCIEVLVTTPPRAGAGSILSLMYEDDYVIKLSKPTTVKLILLTQELGRTGHPKTAEKGSWQFPSLPDVVTPTGDYQMAFHGISLVSLDPAHRASELVTWDKQASSARCVVFDVAMPKHVHVEITLRYRIQVVNQMAARSMWLDPTLEDSSHKPPNPAPLGSD